MAIGTLTINLRFSVDDLLTRLARYEFRDHEEGSFRLPRNPRPEQLRLERWSTITTGLGTF